MVVGCDGLHSSVRQLSWGPDKNFVKYLGYYCGSFITTNYTHREEKTYTSYAEPGRQISRYALRGGRTAFLFVFARERMFEQHPDLEAAKAILRKTFESDRWTEVPEILKRLENCDDLLFRFCQSGSHVGMAKRTNRAGGRCCVLSVAFSR